MKDRIEQVKTDFIRAKDELTRTFAATPDDRINWSPSRSSRTPVQQVAHIAWTVKSINEMLDGRTFQANSTADADRFFRDWERQFSAREDVLALLDRNCADYVAWLESLTPDRLKILVNVLPAQSDYDDGYQVPNAGEDFKKRCGWSEGSAQFSQIDLAKFSQRLRSELDAVKAANLSIDGFEIGNECDWICFNGDVPDGRTPTQSDFMTAVRGYAHFPKAAAEIIRDPKFFPNAQIITFGIAHANDRWDAPPHQHHFSNPASMIAALRNLDGYDYLDNADYHVDGYGLHVYPSDLDNIEQSVADIIRPDAEILGPDKPFWITEWGLDANKYPTRQRQTRSDGIRSFYAALDELHMPLGPTFYYCYSPGGGKGLTDQNGDLTPEASVLSDCATGQ